MKIFIPFTDIEINFGINFSDKTLEGRLAKEISNEFSIKDQKKLKAYIAKTLQDYEVSEDGIRYYNLDDLSHFLALVEAFVIHSMFEASNEGSFMGKDRKQIQQILYNGLGAIAHKVFLEPKKVKLPTKK